MSQSFTLAQLASRFDVTLKGDGDVTIQGVATIADAGPGELSFLHNSKYERYLAITKAQAMVLTPESAEQYKGNALISEVPYALYAKIAKLFERKPQYAAGVHASAVISPDAQIDDSAHIGANVVVEAGAKIESGSIIGAGTHIGERVVIGRDCHLWPNVSVYYDCELGNNVEVHSGAVIGSPGFGFAQEAGEWIKVPQLGRVIIGNNVSIGSNTSIDRGAIGNTHIKDGVQLDNLIQVGHNVEIGENTAIAGCVGIAGSSIIGRNCLLGGGVGIAGHLSICDNVILTAMTGVSASIDTPGVYSAGVPMQESRKWRKNTVRFRELNDMAGRIKSLEKQLQALQSNETKVEE